ncbi:MAG: phage tail assembly protein [Treponema sp.]|jgi:hypothetical protein|nr:phage tail assembly protein [Treponema sp.]
MAKKYIDPFATETITLRVPLTLGERTVEELHFKPPKVKDAIRTDKYEDGTVAAAVALMSSLTGEPEALLAEMIPEDFADCAVILARTNMRFMAKINLFEGQEKDPTTAAQTPPNTAPESLSKASGE